MYKGDVDPRQAYEMLLADDRAVILDVRTHAEWAYVGIPAVDRLIRLSWQIFPNMEINPEFAAQMIEAGIDKDVTILCLCRSGVRSIAAAKALTEAGFVNCYNVKEGFEGDKDASGQRGKTGGWKHAGLPWIQN